MRFRYFLALVTALITLPPTASLATTIASNTAGGASAATGYVGQSFTIVATGSFNDIVLTLPNRFATAGIAGGTGFLFASPYVGTPDALSAATAGLLATATTQNGSYVFGPSILLSGGSQYFFYENALLSVVGGNVYAGGQAFFTPNNNSIYLAQYVSDNFVVSGDAVAATPEPSSVLLLATALLAACALPRSKGFQHLRQVFDSH